MSKDRHLSDARDGLHRASLVRHLRLQMCCSSEGGVGTLLFCALSRLEIDRRYDQGDGGGGCWFQFDIERRQPLRKRQPMEALATDS